MASLQGAITNSTAVSLLDLVQHILRYVHTRAESFPQKMSADYGSEGDEDEFEDDVVGKNIMRPYKVLL